jgi:hypothetical protein
MAARGCGDQQDVSRRSLGAVPRVLEVRPSLAPEYRQLSSGQDVLPVRLRDVRRRLHALLHWEHLFPLLSVRSFPALPG